MVYRAQNAKAPITIQDTYGNQEHLALHKTAFLCSRETPESSVRKCMDWAVKQRDLGKCVISGFHSKTEKDVLEILLSGKQAIILVMACGINKKLDPVIQKAFDAGRILFVSPFTDEFAFPNRERAKTRNQLVIDLADEVMIGYASKGGMIEQLSKNIKGKPLEKPQIKGISPNLKRFIASIALKCREDEDETEYQ